MLDWLALNWLLLLVVSIVVGLIGTGLFLWGGADDQGVLVILGMILFMGANIPFWMACVGIVVAIIDRVKV